MGSCLSRKPHVKVSFDMSGVQKFNKKMLLIQNKKIAEFHRMEIFKLKDLNAPKLEINQSRLYLRRMQENGSKGMNHPIQI